MKCALNIVGGIWLKRPLDIIVTHVPDGVIIENESLDLWGEGNTYFDALEDFTDFFLYEYDAYLKTPIESMDLISRRRREAYLKLRR